MCTIESRQFSTKIIIDVDVDVNVDVDVDVNVDVYVDIDVDVNVNIDVEVSDVLGFGGFPAKLVLTFNVLAEASRNLAQIVGDSTETAKPKLARGGAHERLRCCAELQGFVTKSS